MKLIRKLDVKKDKNGYWRREAIFWCDGCKQEVEKKLDDGLKCKSCGCQQYKLSSELQKDRKKNKKRIPFSEEHRQNLSKASKGKKKSEEHIQKLKEKYPNFVGEKNPNWQNGSSFEEYGVEFNKQKKQQILKRDNYKCQDPNCVGNHKKLHIHHIDYNKKNNNPENLITLCNSCHAKTIGKNKRNYYVVYYQNMMMGKTVECSL